MDEYTDNSLSCLIDNKRDWDLFNDHIDYYQSDQSVAENKKPCIELSLSSPEWSDRQGFSSPSTAYWCNNPEETGWIGPPASCVADPSWSASNTITYGDVLDQSSGNAIAAVYPAAFEYSANQEQLGVPSGTSLGADLSEYEAQIATQPTITQHDQNKTTFPSETLIYPPISIQNSPAYPFSASESSLIPSTWVSQTSSGSTSPTQLVEYQDKITLHGLSGNEPDIREFFDESNGSYTSSDMQGGSRQFTSPQDAPRIRSFSLALDDTESSDLMDCLHTGTKPEQLSSRAALVSGFSEKPYDTCFGMVILKVSCSTELEGTTSRIPLSTQMCGSLLKFYYEVSNKYAGLVDSPTLSRLNQDFLVTLAATLIAPKREKEQKQRLRPREIAVEIVIYGFHEDMDAVGNSLSEGCLYLQHPKEWDTRVVYVNPQYWIRPGSQMPKVEGMSFVAASSFAPCRESLDETRTNQLLRLFDCANGPTIYSEVRPSHRLRTHLQDHQMKALAMMAEKEQGAVEGANFKTLWEVSTDLCGQTSYRHVITGRAQSTPTFFYGGLLADEMGLGKTLSILALISWFLDILGNESPSTQESVPRATLVVAPKSTIPGWQQQIQRHIHSGKVRMALYHGSNRHALSTNLLSYDIVLTNYETLRSEFTGRGQDSLLYSGEWARIVLDEAHHIRNRSSKTFEAASAVRARRRWCLTGTPIHNRLDDYGALLSFIKVPPFTSKALFDHWLASPISNNKPEGLRRLKELVAATCLRRTKDTVKDQLKLPQRIDREETIELDRSEQELYDFFKVRTSGLVAGMFSKEKWAGQQHQGNILPLINFLRLICNHGEQLLPLPALEVWLSRDASPLDWNIMCSNDRRCALCKVDISRAQCTDTLRCEFCLHVVCSKCAATDDEENSMDEDWCPLCSRESANSRSQQFASSFSRDSDLIAVDYRPSTKVKALINNLQQEQRLNNADLEEAPTKRHASTHIFWTKMLDRIEPALRVNGFLFQRIDGQKSLEQRISALDAFNNDPAFTVMLASIGSIAEGYDHTFIR
ncbi:hypothetical protein FGG08_003949 [Glutinoglossum americanum]|uniref:Uncharacterized protein n=1 Tax=Glutinoglossum americanum TaxID=1670608 RepID=A0A9P8I3C0_9PEZI|nr:hypothetical protein FGG08_003949 [Glutinoglossum americanum]